jgi:hypothetical protein
MFLNRKKFSSNRIFRSIFFVQSVVFFFSEYLKMFWIYTFLIFTGVVYGISKRDWSTKNFFKNKNMESNPYAIYSYPGIGIFVATLISKYYTAVFKSICSVKNFLEYRFNFFYFTLLNLFIGFKVVCFAKSFNKGIFCASSIGTRDGFNGLG